MERTEERRAKARLTITVPRVPSDHDGPYPEVFGGKPLHANDIPANAVQFLRNGTSFATCSDLAIFAVLREVRLKRASPRDFDLLVWRDESTYCGETLPAGYQLVEVCVDGDILTPWPAGDKTLDAKFNLLYDELCVERTDEEFGLAPDKKSEGK